MNISAPVSLGAVAPSKPGSVAQAAQLLMLKKAIDLREAGAMELLQALPKPAAQGALGNRVDTFA